MSSRLTDSRIYRHLWGTDELDAFFEERARVQCWIDILIALAEVQAEHGIIPAPAAAAIRQGASADRLDLEYVALATRATGHSMLGLIRGLQRILPGDASQWIFYGATVQDITDAWTGLMMKQVGQIVWRDLRAIEAQLLDLAVRHRDTVMVGRTHGQPGAPITFGFKVAVWADEVRRHVDRWAVGGSRWPVGQLAGAVGTLAFFGDRGIPLRAAFCRRLGLRDPGISWLTARDRVTEYVLTLSMIGSTLACIGSEVYELQRPEIDELREAAAPGSVGSITMPHKRNPEMAEHLVTLSRLIRAQSGAVLESMVHEHERDGRSWKVEWATFPEACLLSGASLSLARRLLAGLEIDRESMLRNLAASRGYYASEQVLAALAPEMGKHRAQALLQDVLADGRTRDLSFEGAIQSSEELRPYLSGTLARIAQPNTGAAEAMVDWVVQSARAARERESDTWPEA